MYRAVSSLKKSTTPAAAKWVLRQAGQLLLAPVLQHTAQLLSILAALPEVVLAVVAALDAAGAGDGVLIVGDKGETSRARSMTSILLVSMVMEEISSNVWGSICGTSTCFRLLLFKLSMRT